MTSTAPADDLLPCTEHVTKQMQWDLPFNALEGPDRIEGNSSETFFSSE